MCPVAQLCSTLSTLEAVALQASLSMVFFRQECWRGIPFTSPGDLPDPVMEPMSPEFPTLAGGFFSTEAPGKPKIRLSYCLKEF